MFASRYGYTLDQFMDLTPRQVRHFSRVISKAKSVQFYEQTLAYASVQGVQLPSLEEFLGVGSKEESAFSEKTDAFLERQALKNLRDKYRG